MTNDLVLEYGDVRADRELEIADDNETIMAYIETWFDAGKKFGVELDSPEESIDMYAFLNPWEDTPIRNPITYIIKRNDGSSEEHFYSPSASEAELIRDAIVDAVREEYYSDSDDEYALKGFVRSRTFPYSDVDVIIHRGDGNFVEIYYNPDSFSEGQIVENYYYSWEVEDAYARAKANSKTEDEMVKSFFDIFMSECRQYSSDVDTKYFDDWEDDFANGFKEWGEVRDYEPNMETLKWMLDRSNIEEEN